MAGRDTHETTLEILCQRCRRAGVAVGVGGAGGALGAGAALHLPFAYVVFVVAEVALLPSFAYPYGALDANAEKALKAAGMQATMTSEEHSNTLTRSPECLFRLGRFERTGFMTTAQLLAKLK